MAKKEHIINAEGKRVGHIAVEASTILNGKNSPEYLPNKVPEVKVVIKNASKLKILPSKFKNKTYITFSGYPGGQKTKTMREVVEAKGNSEILRKAVFGMLPKNKLRSIKMTQLVIEN